MLQMSPAELPDDKTLFGPGSLGLDSVDALQLVVMLDKHFGLKIADPEMARGVLQNVNSMVAAVEKHLRRCGAPHSGLGPVADSRQSSG